MVSTCRNAKRECIQVSDDDDENNNHDFAVNLVWGAYTYTIP